jgi:hypothetical protein
MTAGRPRIATASLAVAGATVLAAFSTIGATDKSSAAAVAANSSWLVPGLLSAFGVAVLGLAIALAYPQAIVLALGFLGTAFLIGLPGSGPWRSVAPLAGGWLLAVAELAYWSIDFRVAGLDDPRIHRRRAALTATLVAAGVASALIPEIGFSPGGLAGIELTALGVIGVGAMLALAAGLAWRLRSAGSGAAAAASRRG